MAEKKKKTSKKKVATAEKYVVAAKKRTAYNAPKGYKPKYIKPDPHAYDDILIED